MRELVGQVRELLVLLAQSTLVSMLELVGQAIWVFMLELVGQVRELPVLLAHQAWLDFRSRSIKRC